jgi:ceramide glucosyltransferase
MWSAMIFRAMTLKTMTLKAMAHTAGFAMFHALSAAASIVPFSGVPLVAPFWRVLLSVALFGTISSTVFLLIVLVAVARNLRLARAQSQAASLVASSALPAVTILKPLHGAEPRLEQNLESFFQQDYPAFELVFGCRNAGDPALAVVERLRARHPNVAIRVVLSGDPAWPSAKVWSLQKMIASSHNDYLVISDSDICVASDFLRNVVPPLLDSANGLVTCLYRGVAAPGLWSRLEALGMSVEMSSGVITADMLEGMQFALGSVLAVRRDALQKCGGIASTAEYYSDDFVLGNRIHAAGYKVVLSHYRVSHVLCVQSFGKTFATQTRWMQSTRYSRPKGHLGTGLTFATPFGILGFIAAAALGHLTLGIALLAWSLLNRIVQSVVVGYRVIGDRHAFGYCWLYPLRDLLGFVVWIASYCGGSAFRWRGELYRFTPGGRIVSVKRIREDHPD